MGTKISALPLGTTPTGAEVIPAVQGGNTVGLTAQQLIRGGLTNTRLAKTALYTVANADKGMTIALGGSGFYTLTFGAASSYDANFAVLVVNEDATRRKDVSIGGFTYRLYPGQSLTAFNQNNTWQTIREKRYSLIPGGSGITLFVDPAGSDTLNDGLSSGSSGAFKTIGHALNILADIDAQQSAVIVSCAAGTYNENITLPNVLGAFLGGGLGSANPTLLGDITTPANCVINGSGVNATMLIFGAPCPDWVVRGFKITNGGTGVGIEADENSWVRLGEMEYGAVGGATHLVALNAATIEAMGAYKISAGAATHLQTNDAGRFVIVPGTTVTLSGTPAFSLFFTYASANSLQDWTGTIFSGSATGSRYNNETGGGLKTGGAGTSFFPGNSGGTTSTPAWYS